MTDDDHIVVSEGGFEVPIVEILTGRGYVFGKSGAGKSVLGGTPVYTTDGREYVVDLDVEGGVSDIIRRKEQRERTEALQEDLGV